PATGGPPDPTDFQVSSAFSPAIPTLESLGLGLLAAALAAAAAVALRRRAMSATGKESTQP
ncbi:MAG: IPTL-CTERM sorting domain-containing protein, partial [Acidobacteriota bacterium]